MNLTDMPIFHASTMLESKVNEAKFASITSQLLTQVKFGIADMGEVQGVLAVLNHLENTGARVLSAEQAQMVQMVAEQNDQLRAEVRRLSALVEGVSPPASLAAPGVAIDCSEPVAPVAVAEEVLPPGAE